MLDSVLDSGGGRETIFVSRFRIERAIQSDSEPFRVRSAGSRKRAVRWNSRVHTEKQISLTFANFKAKKFKSCIISELSNIRGSFEMRPVLSWKSFGCKNFTLSSGPELTSD